MTFSMCLLALLFLATQGPSSLQSLPRSSKATWTLVQFALAHLVSSYFCSGAFYRPMSTQRSKICMVSPPRLPAMPSCALPAQNVTAVAACYVLPFHDACVRENMHLLASFAFFPPPLVLGPLGYEQDSDFCIGGINITQSCKC